MWQLPPGQRQNTDLWAEYNSVIFLTTQANLVTVLPVSEDFLRTGIYDTSLMNQTFVSERTKFFNLKHVPLSDQAMVLARSKQIWTRAIEAATFFSAYINDTHLLKPLSAFECFNAYSQQYISSWGDVMVVHKSTVDLAKMYGLSFDSVGANILPVNGFLDINSSDSLNPGVTGGFWLNDLKKHIYFKDVPQTSDPRVYPSNKWQCYPGFNKTCKIEQNFKGQGSWLPFGQPVKYCLAKKVEEQCTLKFNLDFAVIVIVCNLVKVLCMFLTLWMHNNSALMTIGDAIASFLENPDPYTRGLCIFESRLIEMLWEWDDDKDRMPFDGFIPPIRLRKMDFMEDSRSRQWRPKERRWFVVSLTVALSSFFMSTGGKALSLAAMSNFGIGNAVGNNIVPTNFSLPIAVILANLPQTVISYIYVFFNWLYTSMYSGSEWAKYAKHRRPLRVTSPVGKQRSTYYLQLPYRYSIPLLILSSILAWLISQSFFVVQIHILEHGAQSIDLISSCGYSPGAIVLAIIVGTLIFLATFIMGSRKYPTGIPLTATCSAGISAACHAPVDDIDASVLPVQWGVVSVKDGIGHCSFSSKVVAPPIPGYVYAGTLEDIKTR
ncbi:MAG: hypothetical protein Q9167_001003 [Letrouitia subvulpina]